MNVLLIEDVATLGRTGDVVSVKDGYGRNYLLPQGIAVLATKSAVAQSQNLRRNAERRRAQALSDAQDFANVLGSLALSFARRVGEQGRLFGSVTNGDIATSITTAMGLNEELDKRKVLLHDPIKALGNYAVNVSVHPEVVATVSIEVVGENGETAADYAPAVVEVAVEESTTDEAQPYGDY